MIGVVMIAQALPHKSEEVATFLAQLATMVRKETGNRRYDVCRYEADRNRFLVFEEYVDKDAFDAHMSSPHLVDAANKLPPLLAEELHVRLFQEFPTEDGREQSA